MYSSIIKLKNVWYHNIIILYEVVQIQFQLCVAGKRLGLFLIFCLYNTVIQWLEIEFYCENCLCSHFEHVIQANKKRKQYIYIQTICSSIDYDFKHYYFSVWQSVRLYK